MDRGLGRCLWLDRSCDEGQARQRRAATLTATKDVWFLTLLFCGRFLQAGKPPAPSGPAAGACMPGTAARQIRGELDWLCLENWVVGWESWQCCKFRRGRRNTWGSKRWKSCTACLRLSLRQALGTGPVSLHALRWGTCTKRSLHGLGTENAQVSRVELVSNASMLGGAVGPQLAREELKSAGVCMQIPAGILWVWSRFWVRNLRAHATDLISWTTAYRLHVLPWVQLMHWVDGPWTFVVCAVSCLQHHVLVQRHPVRAFLFNQVEQNKSLSPGSSIKKTLEMVAGLS